jgi:hypothetical protein
MDNHGDLCASLGSLSAVGIRFRKPEPHGLATARIGRFNGRKALGAAVARGED